MSVLKIEKTAYAGWPNCYRLTNGEVELIVTTDVGPRIIRYGFIGGQNLFYECKDQLGNSGEPWWMIRGGHRLWAAPERMPFTYALDNDPIQATLVGDDTITVLQKAPLRKQITITLSVDGRVRLVHTLANADAEPVELAPWALTVMAPGGLGMVAFPLRAPHYKQLLPTNPLVMWAYTDFSDKRWTFTKRYLLLKQDPTTFDAQKAGLFCEKTLAGYLLGSDLFTKQCEVDSTAFYTDYGCSFEIFTNPDFLELETLGRLLQLAPGESTEHVEHWSITRNVHLDSLTDSELDRVLVPVMK
ncbi:MAG: hypothetical protein M3Y57_05380 [Acidobacteriota bacterium]|nr:hypothetical protein [Acidobacteriota bacterium]